MTQTRGADFPHRSTSRPAPPHDHHDSINHRLTLAHVTHEAVEQLGGIGTVLEGLIASPVYQRAVKRSILIGPVATHLEIDPASRLGEHGEVLYSSVDRIDKADLTSRFQPVEHAFDVKIVYGKRRFAPPGDDRTGEAEVLLIDVLHINHDRLNLFKRRLWERFGLDSSRYEKSWDYEEYVRLAEPAFHALRALLDETDEKQHAQPCVLFAHEFMGMPAALQAILEGDDRFRTVFHAHECATARRIVEDHPGHDTMFYNVLAMCGGRSPMSDVRSARSDADAPPQHQTSSIEPRKFVDDVFGDRSGFLRHALISRAYLCDGVIAVGDHTRDELRFLNASFSEHPIELVFNGLPDMEVTLEDKLRSRAMLQEYSEALLDSRPDVLMTHVTRPVISKGLWRDARVCHELDRHLGEQGKTGVLYILTSAGGVRRPQEVTHMEQHYDWPRHHHEGYPDLVGPEVNLHHMVEAFNKDHHHVQIVLVNQFGWSRRRIGQRLPEAMTIADLRRATDVEFGMSTYEPFGISPLEPLGAGALCVISNVCGCRAFVEEVTDGRGSENVIVADFTRLDEPRTIDQLLRMTRAERDAIEAQVAPQIAETLMHRLPWNDAERRTRIETGQKLVKRMGWDSVCEHHLLPLLKGLSQTASDEPAVR